MKRPRRQFLRLIVGAAALPAVSRIASADAYPTRPAHLLVGYPAGGVNDIIARLTGQMLSARLGQPFVIEDRPGAGSNLAAEAVVRARPDGYTLLATSASNAWNATIYQNLNFDFIRDIAPVASVVRTFNIMEVNPSVPAKTVPEFIAYAKANPGKINMGTGGPGSSPQVYGELFKLMAGVDLFAVNYRGGGSSISGLLAGQVQVAFDPLVSSIEHIRAGRLRALAVTSATRSAILPDLPTVAEFVPGFEGIGWQGIGAPKNTPPEIIEKLNREINAGLTDPDLKARLADLGAEPFANSLADFGKFIVEYTDKWAKVIRAAGIKVQ